MKNDDDGGEGYANRLLTLVIVLLAGVTTVCVLAAPLLIRMMSAKWVSEPAQMDVAVAFARYCIPTLFFMGVHVVLGQILNARGRFGAMMWTPVLNNVVVIATFGGFIWAFGGFTSTGMDAETITPEGVRLLGIGTLLGLTVQALAMLPYLRAAGFTFRPRFDWRGHGLGKAARLAKWTFFFVLANQLGMIVVTQLATWAGTVAEKQGYPGTGITAYNYALLLWQMPQAIITVSVMTAVLPGSPCRGRRRPRSRPRRHLLRTAHVRRGHRPVRLRLPGARRPHGHPALRRLRRVRRTQHRLHPDGVRPGLIPYSVQYVVLRGFYAYEDTRTPFYNTVIVATVNAAAPERASFCSRPAGPWSAWGVLWVGLHRRGRRCMEEAEPAARRRSRRAPRHADLRPAGRGRYPGRARGRSGELWHHTGSRQRRTRLAGVAGRGRDRAPGGLRPGCEADEDRGDDRHGRNGPRPPRPLTAYNHRPTPHVVRRDGLWAQLLSCGDRRATDGEAGTTVAERSTAAVDVADNSGEDPLTAQAGDANADEVKAQNTTGTADTDAARTDTGPRNAARPRPASVADVDPPELHSGHKLAGRYRLEECLTRLDGFSSWRAVDEKLRRAVGVHVLPADHPRARPVLAAAPPPPCWATPLRPGPRRRRGERPWSMSFTNGCPMPPN